MPVARLAAPLALAACSLAVVAASPDAVPLVDYHVHLKGGLTLDRALEISSKTGIRFGFAVNCGQGFPVSDDDAARAFLKTMREEAARRPDTPFFVAMQAEGREWTGMFSRDTVAAFDYVFTDSMTFTDDQGRRTRLWIPAEVVVGDPQAFMDMYVDRTVRILENEPIDILVNPTFLPEEIAPDYDALWTPERMDRVIAAAVGHGVAIEVNQRYRIPSARFVCRAKAAGARFSFGTNNADPTIGDLTYGLQVARDCGLTAADMFVPRPDEDKPIRQERFLDFGAGR
jgi:hypothetical protein